MKPVGASVSETRASLHRGLDSENVRPRPFVVLVVLSTSLFLAGVDGCVLVMDTDFGDYHEREQLLDQTPADAAPADENVGVDAGADVVEASADVVQEVAHDSALVDASEEPRETCFDNVQNQNETGVDCGGVCKPCEPIGFHHFESFNHAPDGWGPDGEYSAHGVCNDAVGVDGWVIGTTVPAGFTKASGRFATIDSLSVLGPTCDDIMVSPPLATHGATTLTIEFDSNFKVDIESTASVWLVRDKDDGVKVWERTTTGLDEHVKIGNVPVLGAKFVRVVFRYQAYYEYFWDVDNIAVRGQ